MATKCHQHPRPLQGHDGVFLQALAKAYRKMAMLAPTIIIGDMNAAPIPADRGGHATTQDHAVCNTSNMLGLVDWRPT